MYQNRNEKIEIGNCVPHIKVAEWLPVLLTIGFFVPCREHSHLHMGQVNNFCINCTKTMCLHCVDLQECRRRKHHILQIRRYFYQDVIRIEDIQSFLDCSDIQPYTVNGVKSVRLRPMAQPKQHKARDIMQDCLICKGPIKKLFRFCSIDCLVSVVPKDSEWRNSSNRSTVAIPSLVPDPEEMPTQGVTDLKPENSLVGDRNSVISSKKTHRRKGKPAQAPFF